MGKVYIVGAGPGSIDHLTVRAQRVLARADVLAYDALVDPQIVGMVPATCECIDVGKRGGERSTPQAEIDRLLVELGRSDRTIVRLKSGDPFIFGRTTSEIDALNGAGIGCEVIPGLSAALAAPLFASIPLTDPVLSRGFAVVTAHLVDDLDWESLGKIETVVVLMGGKALPAVVQKLLLHDRSPQTPIAIIQWAGTNRQRIWEGNLGTIVSDTQGETLSPATIVIGEVVRLRHYLQSAANSSFPLAGKTVLVTRAATQAGEFTQLLADAGARVLEMPTLEIVPPSSWAGLDESIANLNEFDWLILTSTNAVDYFYDRLRVAGKDSRALGNLKIAVVGRKTAQSLGHRGIEPDYIPPAYIADELAVNFPVDPMGVKILFPRVETGGREVLVQQLTDRGATVVEVAAYQSQCPKFADPNLLQTLQRGEIDILTFASSKTVQNFAKLVDSSLADGWQKDIQIASIGPQTSVACRELFQKVDIEATEYTLPGLVRAIVDRFS
jgi:uroporphyrinogen III methyltransferase / synthase